MTSAKRKESVFRFISPKLENELEGERLDYRLFKRMDEERERRVVKMIVNNAGEVLCE